MLVCNKCGKLRESSELGYAVESHGERHLDTNCSCGGEFVPATRCSLCGKWFDGTDLHGVCEVCLDDNETVGVALEIGDANRENVEINSFIASILNPDRINHILEKYVEEHYTDHSDAVIDYLEADMSAFAEFLEDKYKE